MFCNPHKCADPFPEAPHREHDLHGSTASNLRTSVQWRHDESRNTATAREGERGVIAKIRVPSTLLRQRSLVHSKFTVAVRSGCAASFCW
jgi:hypothetical protein